MLWARGVEVWLWGGDRGKMLGLMVYLGLGVFWSILAWVVI